MTARTCAQGIPPVDLQLSNALRTAVESLTKALGPRVSALVAQQLASGANNKAIEKELAAAMPAMVEQTFVEGFLLDESSARRNRAWLAHLLSVAELRNVNGAALELPKAVAHAETAAEVADELTSEEAAKLLHVSRTHLNSLVDTGQLGEVRRTAGGHRRISKDAVLSYKAASKNRRAQGLEAMAEASERLGLYDGELAAVPRRAKR